MSYQVSARKWRPQSFDEVSGQNHVTTALRNAITTGRIPHALLLTGPRGVGKTTLARILARCLNCDSGPTDTPCGKCPSCQEISEGRSTDVQEVDAASRTSVDDVRGLIESIRYAPSPGKYRIFIVDEVHMLSTAAFNALLKTLEEPPPSSLFVLATTNPEKIPFTVLSRCQRYDLRRISTKEISARLNMIAESEDVTISDSSLLAIAREGDGSMRDAQTLYDQVIAYGGTDIRDEVVAEVLDLIDRRVLLEIIEACIDQDAAAALRGCHRAASGGSDPKRISEMLIGLLRDLVVLRVAPDSKDLVEGNADEIAELVALAQRTEEARLRRMFRALVREQEDLAWAPDPLAVLEMAMVRLAGIGAGDDVARLLSRIDALERRLADGSSGAAPTGGGAPRARGSSQAASGRGSAAERTRTAGASAITSQRSEVAGPTEATPPPEREMPANIGAKASANAESISSAPAVSNAPAVSSTPAVSKTTKIPSSSAVSDPRPVSKAEQVSSAQAAPGVGAPLLVVFDRLRGLAREQNPRLFAAIEGMQLTAREPGRIQLAAPSEFNKTRLEARREELETFCAAFFGEPTRVEIIDPPRTQQASSAPQREDARRLRQEALNHPSVNIALEILEADIVEIRPLGPGSGGAPR